MLDRPPTPGPAPSRTTGDLLVSVLLGGVALALTVVLALSQLTGFADAAASAPSALSAPSARSAARLDADPGSQAAAAAARDERFARLARHQVGTWLTGAGGAGGDTREVGATVRQRLRGAAQRGGSALLVLYAIPKRDCSAYSSGGFATHADYRRWVDAIAGAVRAALSRRSSPRARPPLVVLEPDALAMLGSCAGQGDRLGSLRYAGRALSRAGARVYLDAGNSAWLPSSTMAGRLRGAGVASVRGFATNVSNMRPTADETAYADAINRALDARGTGRRHYVLDTSRNGASPAVPAGQWCNPPSARVGATPRWVSGRPLDALLWVKPPGESDGECGRGEPSAGAWWPAGALRLLGRG
ncbi:glycoside hydrolase family 6 protein [Nocardioides sp.]|uniref:glycoside hydrolase family 6 protein n=1 Tax=Nocardioides sp. TaxID=35761 RepID=UPI0035131177